MKPITYFLMLVVSAVLVLSCNKVTYRKTAGGMPYQVFKGKGDKAIVPGNFLKITLTQKIKDSVYFTTGKLPIYLRVNEISKPYELEELWTKLQKGDSAVATQMMDTFIKRAGGNFPKQFRMATR